MEEPGQRYDPVGSSSECNPIIEQDEHAYFKSLETEQEKLSTSLQALTSHFAQVQFRLRQIISAPEEQKFNLIENLDEFASRGIPELSSSNNDNDECILSAINQQRVNQFQLIKKLQSELSAASIFANENVIDLKIKNSEMIVNEEVLDSTDTDLSRLKTEIFNVDTFVTDLRYETINLKRMTQAMVGYTNCEKTYKTQSLDLQCKQSTCHSFYAEDDGVFTDCMSVYKNASSTHTGYEKSLQEARRGPSTEPQIADTNHIKASSPNVYHWENIRAKLETDVQNIISVVSIEPLEAHKFDRSNGVILMLQKEITKMVRKELCGTLRELMEHGLQSIQYEMNFLHCCVRRAYKRKKLPNTSEWKGRHAWDIIMEFYNKNDGSQRYRKPCNTLNESFQLKHLSIASTKEQLLKAIGDVINIYVRFNTSQNSYFKALVVLGLNVKKLPHWLSLIFKCSDLIEANYSDESLVCQPEFADVLQCLDLLSSYEFNLPVDTLADRFHDVRK